MKNKTNLLAAIAFAVVTLTATSPAFAHKAKQPAMDHNMMMGDGNMMGEMTKMMTTCNQMMAMMMKGMSGNMNMDGQTMPGKKN